MKTKMTIREMLHRLEAIEAVIADIREAYDRQQHDESSDTEGWTDDDLADVFLGQNDFGTLANENFLLPQLLKIGEYYAENPTDCADRQLSR